jgi:hypothetical protein
VASTDRRQPDRANTQGCPRAATSATATTYQNDNNRWLVDFGTAMGKMQNRCGFNPITKKPVPCILRAVPLR